MLGLVCLQGTIQLTDKVSNRQLSSACPHMVSAAQHLLRRTFLYYQQLKRYCRAASFIKDNDQATLDSEDKQEFRKKGMHPELHDM